MKYFLWLSTAVNFSCSTINPVPSELSGFKSFEYCGGELWGYFIPIGARMDKGFWQKQFKDPKPLMAVFLHMHSDLEKDPEHSLTMHLVIRSLESIRGYIPDDTVAVRIGDKNAVAFPLHRTFLRDALGIEELYPSSQYKTDLVDAKTNQWRVAKKYMLLPLLTQSSQIVDLPVTEVGDLDSASSFKIDFDSKKFAQLFIVARSNIWPAADALKDTEISVHIPDFNLDGHSYGPYDLRFIMAYEKVKKHRSSFGRCPSTDEIFRFNE